MKCQEIKKYSLDYLDRQLEEERLRPFNDHLKVCSRCEKKISQMKRSWDLLGSIKEIEPSPDFTQNFWKRIAQLEAQKKLRELPAAGWSWWLFKGWRLALVPALGFLLVLSIYLIRLSGPEMAIPTEDEIQMVEFMDLLQDMAIIENLEMLENFETIIDLPEV